MMNVLVANGNFIQFDFFRERFFFKRFSQSGCKKVDFQSRESNKAFQHGLIDGAGATPQRRKFVVEHEEAHYRSPVTRRKMYIGRLFASSKIRPTYSPITPNVISWMPARKKMETIRLA